MIDTCTHNWFYYEENKIPKRQCSNSNCGYKQELLDNQWVEDLAWSLQHKG